MFRFAILIFFISNLLKVCSQDWEHTFNSLNSVAAYAVVQDYDDGVLMVTVDQFLDSNQEYVFISKLYKLNINGEIIWRKNIGKKGESIGFSEQTVLTDGSLFLGGG